jgi:hypothetical protein
MTAPCDIGDDIERRCSNRAAVRKHARDAPVRGLWPGYRSPCGGPSVSGGTRHSNASPHNPRKWRARTLRSRGGSRVPRAPGQRFARAEARRGHLADRRCVLCHQALRSFCTADHLVKQDQQDSVRGSSMFFTRKKSSAELPK